MNYYIGIDLGGTNVRIAQVDEEGKIIKDVIAPSHGLEGPEKIEANIPDVTLNGPKDFTKRHPGNLNVSFSYIEGESIVLLLDANGICVNTGSACS
ncbi:MAG: aminotransferase class V-fold PLP-dependent enzyme [Erysipelotrichaceae bacterium]|nr:aminotransferase class V-fold PLP-dependent enzyme [Erysipelotrichaceae bacterium]